MTEEELIRLRYPIGPMPYTRNRTIEQIHADINEIEKFPAELHKLVSRLTEEDYGKRYKPGGWTIAQVIHHVIDSHINAYVRTRWCLTEDSPVIKPYFENKWSSLADANEPDLIPTSISLLTAVHKRWVYLLRDIDDEQWSRVWIHPAMEEPRQLAHIPEIYSWHGKHHGAHILSALENPL